MTVLREEDLEFDYDDEEDILYILIGGRRPQPALTYETDEGHLVRLDPETLELVGAEILSYRERWEGKDIHLEWNVSERGGFFGMLKQSRHEEALVRRPRHPVFE